MNGVGNWSAKFLSWAKPSAEFGGMSGKIFKRKWSEIPPIQLWSLAKQ
jgi:hypothetical protein